MNPSHKWLGLCVLCFVSIGGCGDDDDTAGDAGCASDADCGALAVTTFNTGLLDTVGYVDARAPQVIDALAASDDDVLCVQEVWSEEHWDALVEANEDVRPHVLRIEPMPGVQGQCTPDELEPLRACAELSCAGVQGEALISCVSLMCEETRNLSGACIACLLDNATGDLDAFVDACLGSASGGSGDEPLPPDERAYFLGGSFGIGLLSKHPLLVTDTLVLDASTTRRGVLYATLDTEMLGELAVFCTHLTPVQNDVRYEGSYGDWAGENEAHVRALLDFVDDKTGGQGPVLVLGDLNNGPTRPGVAPELEDSYALLTEAGFADPFLDGPNAACTFCVDNPLVSPDDTGVNAALDHVLTRDLGAAVDVTRTLMQRFGNDSDAGADKLPLSDHYALQARIEPAR